MTRRAIHPGEILAGELADMGLNGAALAAAIHVPANRIYQLLNGKRALTGYRAATFCIFWDVGGILVKLAKNL